MTRKRLAVLAAIPLAVLAIAAFVASQSRAPTAQSQAPRAQTQAPQAATPADFVSSSGSVALQLEIERLRAQAKEAEAARAQADGDETPSVAYLRASRAIWEDDRLRDTPWIIQAGKDILNVHRYRHDHQRRLDTSVEILAVIDANRQRWLSTADSVATRERMAEHIDGQMMTILSGMQGAYNVGRPQLTLAALERIIAIETDDKKRENFIKQRDDRRKRMAIGLYGPEEPPTEWRLP